MQLRQRLDDILLDGVGKSVWGGLSKIKEGVSRSIRYLDEKLKEIGNKTYEKLRETKNKISEYMPIIKDSAIASLPYTTKVLILAGSSMKNTSRGLAGRAVGYLLIGAGAATLGLFVLSGIHGLPSPNNENIQYVGSPDGYQGFVPKGVINYEGQTNPRGDLILNDGRVLNNAVWHGKYSDTIIENNNQIVKLNNYFVGKINPVNNQPFEYLQDVYVIKGQVPIKEITINGQIHYVIDANKIHEANVAGFYTYKEWVDDFVAAMNTPGTTAARLPGDSPVFKWTNTIGIVAYQTKVYQQYYPYLSGGAVLIQPNGTIIPYGIFGPIIGVNLSNFGLPKQLYNPSS
ncbi:MAG: hypothetical protein ACO2ON_02320 [Candidatus Nanopusillus sp.]